MEALKATYIDENHFRVLAIPFGGPFNGRDMDGEYFSPNTDIKADWFESRPVLWHHGQDRYVGDKVIGKATLDDEPEEDGWWVDVWLKRADRYAKLVQGLQTKAPLYGSSGTISYLKKAASDGEILVWPYIEQTLTLTPSNTRSVSRPAKAVLDAFDSAEIPVAGPIKAWLTDLESLHADLTATPSVSEWSATQLRDIANALDAVEAAWR